MTQEYDDFKANMVEADQIKNTARALTSNEPEAKAAGRNDLEAIISSRVARGTVTGETADSEVLKYASNLAKNAASIGAGRFGTNPST
jgi:hypothetical protein